MSARERKSSNFIIQGGILAITGIISRLIGLLYRMPLQRTIGDAGMGYYSAAFQIYSIMLIISSYSLPTAVSKLVAARIARGHYRNARKIYRCALMFAILSGGATGLIVLFGADSLAGSMMRLDKSAIALRMLAPTLLIVALMGVIRGYFQGLGSMMPTAVSQLVEQIVNAIVSVVAAILLFSQGEKVGALLHDPEYAYAYGAAGGTLGTGAGALAGFLILVVMLISHNRSMNRDVAKDPLKQTEETGKIFRVLILTILPIILSTTIYNISDTIDQGVFNFVMDQKSMSAQKAELWGIFSTKYRVLTNVPIALSNALCASMMPTLTASIERGELRQARHKVALATRFVMVLSIPCAVGLAVLGGPIVSILFKGNANYQNLPAKLLAFGSVSVVFYSLSTLSNGILQGIDKMRIPVRNAFFALIVHLGILYVTLEIFEWGLYGVVVSCILFGLLMSAFNWLSIRKHLEYKQEIIRTFVIPLIASLFMGLVVGALYFICHKFLPMLLAVVISIVVGACVYFVLLIKFRGVREHEIRKFPGGDFMADIAISLHLL
ncbi:MAG: polysaccharide biosynthesis protein [Lachnospiraceae bacterium]|nr:polysaccharide biosynthesis protein [Lachnospiraceae bacterium]